MITFFGVQVGSLVIFFKLNLCSVSNYQTCVAYDRIVLNTISVLLKKSFQVEIMTFLYLLLLGHESIYHLLYYSIIYFFIRLFIDIDTRDSCRHINIYYANKLYRLGVRYNPHIYTPDLYKGTRGRQYRQLKVQ